MNLFYKESNVKKRKLYSFRGGGVRKGEGSGAELMNFILKGSKSKIIIRK